MSSMNNFDLSSRIAGGVEGALRTTEEVTTRLIVRPNDLDSLGHVNNAVVLEYLEAGRWAWLDHHDLRRGGRVIPVVARIEIDYRREILPPEVVVTTSMEDDEAFLSPGYLRFQSVFRQAVKCHPGEGSIVAAEARAQVAFIDTVDRTLRSVQDYFEQAARPRHESRMKGAHDAQY